MEKGTHGQSENKFEELNLQGQSRVINAQIQVLQKSIKANLRKINTIENRNRRKSICVKQLEKCLANIMGIDLHRL